MSRKVVIVDDVSIKFLLKKERQFSKKKITNLFSRNNKSDDEFWAVRNVSFDVEKGDRLGILGLNGAGKSTILKMIAGVMKPTLGSVKTKGRIVPLIELGAGFNSRYTGRENIYLRGAVLGYPKEFIEKKFDKIVEFSELKKFIDVPLEKYSSGMKSKLGFAISTMVEPDILILDEVLSVGDAKFKKKSFARMMELIENERTTVLFVSHSLGQVRKLCNKAVWMEKGKVKMVGESKEVCDAYANYTASSGKRKERRAKVQNSGKIS
ncbi:ABC transporter ATP-binding protein [Methanobrevibacter filiformis]|uniref:Teichoic acids export ATP-binding protein TagH n=1 Tax=Methanobrevibacter filiformis TaxID=55758 RepID=A0A166CY45_9EURY|nr:ABC transporter ATP-binding protein [Methanobrevibacter filiformis]KZX17557.1 teichoic acids export ATP-binding protein TagH [Methanobrevibacter filiformis]